MRIEDEVVEITAAVVSEPSRPLKLEQLELAELRDDEIRVRVEATGICHADIFARDQIYPIPLPAVFGHEGAGVVEEVGNGVNGVEAGDTVVLAFNSCGQCVHCLGGHPGSCETSFPLNWAGRRPDGSSPITRGGEPVSGYYFGQSSFASHVNVPARLAVPVHGGMPAHLLAPLACGVMTGAGAVVNTLAPKPGSAFAVFGTGAVGFAALLAARAAGVTNLIAVDQVDAKLRLARRLGATHTVNSRETDPVEAIRGFTDGTGVDYAVDAVGVPEVFTQMANSLAKRGHGVLVGVPAPGREASLELGALINAIGPRLSMVVEGDALPREFIPRLVRLYDAGLLPLDELVQTYRPEDIDTAFADVERGAVVKPVITWS